MINQSIKMWQNVTKNYSICCIIIIQTNPNVRFVVFILLQFQHIKQIN